MQCTAHKKTGEQCRARALAGGRVCIRHGGNAPQVRRRAAQRLLEASDSAAAYLVSVIRDDSKPDAIRLAAARDLLDRAGLGGKERVEVEVVEPEKPLWEQILPQIFHVVPDADATPVDAAGAARAAGQTPAKQLEMTAVPAPDSEAAHQAYLASRNAPDPMPPGATQRVDGPRPRGQRRRRA